MKHKLILVLLLALSLVCVVQAQSGPLRLYDNFKGPWLDPAKWAAIPTCSATQFINTAESINLVDCIRAIEANKLRLMVKAYGHADSDTDRQFGPSELYFANPNAVSTINVTFRISQSETAGCPSNSTDSISQVLIGGIFFNSGTGDPLDDVNVFLIVQREVPGTQTLPVIVAGAAVFSGRTFYRWVDLGTPNLHEPMNAKIIWDQPNHRFLFSLAGASGVKKGEVSYPGPDFASPVAPMKLLAARAFVPNCTTQRTSADMNVFFDNVFTNR